MREEIARLSADSRFKTMRHIETVRNYLNFCIQDLQMRAVAHDQTKLQDPELPIFDEMTPKLRSCTYGSDEYKGFLKQMQVALDHHYAEYPHHPEHFKNGIKDMTLLDVLEMLVDWKSSTLRHDDGDIMKSIEINQKRFGYSDELKQIFINTAQYLNDNHVPNHARES